MSVAPARSKEHRASTCSSRSIRFRRWTSRGAPATAARTRSRPLLETRRTAGRARIGVSASARRSNIFAERRRDLVAGYTLEGALVYTSSGPPLDTKVRRRILVNLAGARSAQPVLARGDSGNPCAALEMPPQRPNPFPPASACRPARPLAPDHPTTVLSKTAGQSRGESLTITM